ncbi:MAG TPA: aminoglycoside phosphotransferase family protein [Pyrinomonadaceae bacterium]|nr:aminoglycoside phosphotransferase family protein [Pyrinomonadaceae bacterium]
MAEKSDRGTEVRHYRRVVAKIVRRHFGTPARRIVYKASGLTNYVFAVNHLDGQFVIRISPDPERIGAFRKEWWAAQHVRKAGVPSVDILAVGDDVGPEPYMITRRVSGAEATHHPKRQRVVREMGRFGAIINSIETNGFGTNFDWNDAAPKIRTWSEYLDQEYKLQNRLEFFATHAILPESELNKLSTIMEQTRTADVKAALNHSDLRLKNVIVDDDGDITAIIDWEECMSAIAPEWELSIALHDLSIDEKHAFIEGYGLKSDKVEQMAPLIKAFNILNYHSAIAAAIEQDDQSKLSEMKLRLNGTLDLFSLAC